MCSTSQPQAAGGVGRTSSWRRRNRARVLAAARSKGVEESSPPPPVDVTGGAEEQNDIDACHRLPHVRGARPPLRDAAAFTRAMADHFNNFTEYIPFFQTPPPSPPPAGSSKGTAPSDEGAQVFNLPLRAPEGAEPASPFSPQHAIEPTWIGGLFTTRSTISTIYAILAGLRSHLLRTELARLREHAAAGRPRARPRSRNPPQSPDPPLRDQRLLHRGHRPRGQLLLPGGQL